MNNECVLEQPICKYGKFDKILLVWAYSAGADLAWCGADLANGLVQCGFSVYLFRLLSPRHPQAQRAHLRMQSHS